MDEQGGPVAAQERWPQRTFAAVAIVVGLALAAVTPPFQVPDEEPHFLRAYQLSEGVVVAPGHGCVVPASLGDCLVAFQFLKGRPWTRTTVAAVRREFARPLEPARRQFLHIDNTAVYSPVPYGPAIVGTLVGRWLRWPPVAILYGGRVASVLGYAAVGWLAIVATPVLRWPLAMVLAAPLPLFLAASDSADPMTIAVAALATGLAVRVAVGPRPARWPVVAAMAIAMVALPLRKAAYAPLVLMVAAVPRTNWGRRRWAALVPVGIVAAALVGAAVWSHLSDPMGIRERGGDPTVQLAWMGHHPLAFAAVLARTATTRGAGLLVGSIGLLGWMDTPLQPLVIVGYGAVVLWLAMRDSGPPLPAWARLVAATAAVGAVVLAAASVYAMWDVAGTPTVEGFQGRYLLPLAMPVLLVIGRRGRRPISNGWPMVVIGVAAVYAAVAVANRYYGGG